MSSGGTFHTAEGSARKRQKTSRHGGRPTDMALPATSQITAPPNPVNGHSDKAAVGGNGAENPPCHHEQALQVLRTDLEAMRQLITCKICQRFLYEPYALSCGHTFCYGCLTQWMGQNRKQTCPDCRTVIKDQPTPSYLIRELVLVFIKRTELLADGETAEEHHQLSREEAELVSKDKANTDPRYGGLFKGIFRRGGRRPLIAIHDPSDHVDRCPQCLNEVEDGYCNTCQRRVRIESDEDDDEDFESDDSGVLDSDYSSELDHEMDALDGNADSGLYDLDAGHSGYEDSEVDEDAAPYQDDVFDRFHHYRQVRRNERQRSSRRAGPIVEELLDSDEDSEDDTGSLADFVVNDTEGVQEISDEEDSEVNATHPPQPRRRPTTIVLSDDEEDNDTLEEAAIPRSRRHRRPVMSVRVPHNSVQVTSDRGGRASGQGSEDDEPSVRNSRRSGRSRRTNRPITTIRILDDSDSDEHAELHNDNMDGGGFSPLQPSLASSTARSYSDDDVDDNNSQLDYSRSARESGDLQDGGESDLSDASNDHSTHQAYPQASHGSLRSPRRRSNGHTRLVDHSSARSDDPMGFQPVSRLVHSPESNRPLPHPFHLGSTLARINGRQSPRQHNALPSISRSTDPAEGRVDPRTSPLHQRMHGNNRTAQRQNPRPGYSARLIDPTIASATSSQSSPGGVEVAFRDHGSSDRSWSPNRDAAFHLRSAQFPPRNGQHRSTRTRPT